MRRNRPLANPIGEEEYIATLGNRKKFHSEEPHILCCSSNVVRRLRWGGYEDRIEEQWEAFKKLTENIQKGKL